MKIRRMLTLLGVGVVTLTAMSTTVKAEEVSSETSEATVTFEENNGVPSLINPDSPKTEFPDEEEKGTENTGPLSLDNVPSIEFGANNEISATEKKYSALSKDYSPFVQVTDNRGTGAGWQLSASFSEFSSVGQGDEETKRSLPGAEIILSNGGIVTNGSQSIQPTSGNNDKDFITLTEENTAIMSAGIDEGMGSWAMVWSDTNEAALVNENIQLKVPGGVAMKDTYTATITWSLTTGPIPQDDATTESAD